MSCSLQTQIRVWYEL